MLRGGGILVAVAIAVAAFAACGSGDKAAPAASVPSEPPKVTASDLGQLVISGIRGTRASSALKRRVRRGDVAGVIVMGDNIKSVAQIRALTRSLRSAADAGRQLPPLVLVDQEGGTVKRFASAAPNRSAQSMSRLSLTNIERAGRATARDLADRGVNVDLAPVADVVTNRGNFLGTRAFSGTASQVGDRACAFAAGLTGLGVGATLKHFPGLGAAGDINTDDGSVRINAPKEQLSAGWTAYRSCGAAPLTLAMIASASYPRAYGSRQAVVNPAVYKDLRGLIGASGVIVTDALNAVAVKNIRSIDVRAIDAGADLLLHMDESSAAKATGRLRAAMRSGSLEERELSAKVARVKALRESLGD